MYTKFTSLFSLALLALLCLLGTSAQSADCATKYNWDNSTSPGSFTELDITWPDTLNVQTSYYVSTTGNIDVDIVGCSDMVSDGAIQSIYSTLSNSGNSITLNLASDGSKVPTTSAAPRTAVPGSILLALLASLFFFPKNRLGACVLACVLCVALCAPLGRASSGATVTVRVGIPANTITTICENGNCNPYPPIGDSTTGSSSTTDSSTTTDPSSSTTGSTVGPTVGPTGAPAALYFNLRVLIMAAKPASGYGSSAKNVPNVIGGDFAAAAFDTVGMQYDYLVVTATTDLSATLSTTGPAGLYSGIVTVNDKLLSDAQQALVVEYQKVFGVKWVVIGSTGAGLPGVTMGARVTNTEFFLKLAPEFSTWSAALNPNIRVNNSYAINWSGYAGVNPGLYPATVTDSTVVTPFIMAELTGGDVVAAAAFKMGDGTQQLHYFVEQTSEWVHSMVFGPPMVNWVSPGGLFIGARRLTLSVQPDDLFLGSNMWNTTTHTDDATNPNAPWYRMSAQDLQNLADYLADLNSRLPTGSYLTVEWPTNFGGVNDYTPKGQTDDLYNKAVELKDKFYFLSHTWDHPCTLESEANATQYTDMYEELSKNIAYLSTFFGDDLSHWSPHSMITPCVTGLHAPGVLLAMNNNGITACVSDETVTGKNNKDYEPITPYHGVYSDLTTNGYVGMYFVPREGLDIDYCDINPDMVVDEYNFLNPGEVLTFEQIMDLQRMYGVQDKIGFRHDPFMLHQANGATFSYDDPVKGATWNTSLIALWMERVVTEMMTYYSLPIYQPQMDTLVQMFQQRDAMDACGITTTLGVSIEGQIVSVGITSQNTCEMSLSGGAVLSGDGVTMETYGPETTAWVQLTASTPLSFTIPPVQL